MNRALSWRAVLGWTLLALLPALPFMSKFYLALAFEPLPFGPHAMNPQLFMG